MVKKKTTKKKKSSSSKVIKRILLVLLILIIIVGVAIGGAALAMIKSAPPLDVNAILNLNEDSMIFDNKEQFMDYVPTVEKRSIISLKDMSENLKHAIVSIEDERFYSHNGLDFKRILGAVYIDVKNIVTGKQGLHGASTITQQLLKNTLLTNEVNMTRKVQEMYLALQLEKKLSKDQILEAYLNTIALGGRAYGVEAASIQYFSKKAKDLNLIESAYIVGVTQNPSKYYAFSPAAKKDPSPYINRTKTVLGKMYDNGYISEEELTAANTELDTKGMAFSPQTSDSNKLNYEWFSVPVMEKVKKDLKAKYNYTDEEVKKILNYGGLKIYTTMDKSLQDFVKNEVFNKAHEYLNIPNKPSSNGLLEPQLGAAVIDYRNGEVKALVGGRGDHPPMSYNRAASTKYLRQAGSTIKPLTVYGPLLDLKLATAGTVIEDSPVSYGTYSPKNVNNDYQGYVTLREAVRQSINVVATKGEMLLGINNGIAYGEKFGMKFGEKSRSLPSVALGEFSGDGDGTNPLMMAAAYGTFGNGGLYTEPVLYTKVEDRNGKVLLDGEVHSKKVMSPQAAYIMYDMLKGPVSYTGTNAKFGSMPVSGKTGSSSNFKNLWFSGLTPYYSAAVWMGTDVPEDLNTTYGLNSNHAALVWGKIMKKVHEGLDYKEIQMPNGVVTAQICGISGKLATDLCAKHPGGSKVYTEYFIEGTEPTTLCDLHVEAKINKLNGKLATDKTPKSLIELRVFIKRDYVPSASLADQSYVLPKEIDDMVEEEPKPTPEPPATPPEDNKDKDKNKFPIPIPPIEIPPRR